MGYILILLVLVNGDLTGYALGETKNLADCENAKPPFQQQIPNNAPAKLLCVPKGIPT